MFKSNPIKKSPMRLQKLEIEMARWGDNEGKYQGRASFTSKNADVAIKVSPAMAQKIIDMCADALIEASHEMADVMRADIIEGMSTEKKLIR